MSKIRDLTGMKFSRLEVLGKAERPLTTNHPGSFWKCKCDCGEESIARSDALKSGRIKSCGCLHREMAAARASINGKKSKTHGKSTTRIYKIWSMIIDRCTNLKSNKYPGYGGRGITVCERWLESFENFYADMGDRPSPKHQIDRIDNDKGYCKENCRWATPKEQCRNRTNNRIIEFNGEKKPLSEWAELKNMSGAALAARLKRGWSIEAALNKPLVIS